MFDRFPTDEGLKQALQSSLIEAVGMDNQPRTTFDRWGTSGVGVTWTQNGYQLRIHAWLEGGALTREVRAEAAAWRDDRDHLLRRVIFLPGAVPHPDVTLYERFTDLRQAVEQAADDVEQAPAYDLMRDPRTDR